MRLFDRARLRLQLAATLALVTLLFTLPGGHASAQVPIEVFAEFLPLSDVYPNCAATECAEPIGLQAAEIQAEPFILFDEEGLSLLPTPLQGAVYGGRNDCAEEELDRALLAARQRSLQLGETGYGTVADDYSYCFGIVTPDTRSVVTLFWSSGFVTGWSTCGVGEPVTICDLYAYPTQQVGDEGRLLYITVSLLADELIPPMTRQFASLMRGIVDMVSQRTGEVYANIPPPDITVVEPMLPPSVRV